jgi:tripartite-type tricarboxylate transporter receptor subunit TctC
LTNRNNTSLRRFLTPALLAMLLPLAPAAAADFYKGKTVTLIAPSSAGGGYDTYTRLLARHMGAHLPGKPNFVVQNMPGAGGKVAAAYIYSKAAKDGTVIAGTFPQALTEALLGKSKRVQYKTSELTYIGSLNGEAYLCFVRTDAPVKTPKDLFSKELVVGATGQGSSTTLSPALLRNMLGMKFKVITGYKGSRQVTLAAMQNEVQGWCGMGFSSIEATVADEFKNGRMKVLFQEGGEPDPRGKKMNLTLATSFAKTDEERKIFDLIYAQQDFGRPYIAPPGLPKERVDELRAAFDKALKDPAMQADAKKVGVDLEPMSGAKLQGVIAKLYSTPQALVDKARKALDPTAALSDQKAPKK